MVASSTAVEVAEMETMLNELRERLRDVELTNRALEAENALYQSRNGVLEESALNELVRSTQMRQILTDMSALLIAGLKKMEENVDAARRDRAEREARRLEQERALEVGSGDLPIFMDQEAAAPVTAPSRSEAEALGEEIETSSLDRIPVNEWGPDPESDIEKLAKLGEPDKGPSFR